MNEYTRHIAHVFFANGDVIHTEINGTLETVKDYYKPGKAFNIGLGGNDNLQPVTEVHAYPKKCTLKEGATVLVEFWDNKTKSSIWKECIFLQEIIALDRAYRLKVLYNGVEINAAPECVKPLN